MEKVYLGIDPGLHGGIVCIDSNEKIIYRANTPIDKNEEYIISEMLILVQKRTTINNVIAYIEEPIAMPFLSSVALAKSFYGYGIWRALLAISLLQVFKVTPSKWEKEIIGKSTKMTYNERKKRNAIIAQKLFPEFRFKQQTKQALSEIKGQAEALLIALYAKQQDLGNKKYVAVEPEPTKKKQHNENFFTLD